MLDILYMLLNVCISMFSKFLPHESILSIKNSIFVLEFKLCLISSINLTQV